MNVKPVDSLLVIDDAADALKDSLEEILGDYDLHFARSGEEGLEILDRNPEISLVILDMAMPPTVGKSYEEEGLAVMRAIGEIDPLLPVLMLSSSGEVDLVVRAIKEGAYWYLLKPPQVEEMRVMVRKALEESRAHRFQAEMDMAGARELPQRNSLGKLVGRSPLMRSVFQRILYVGQTDFTVLILGETGVGKELVAREIHRVSPRRKGPYVALNTAGFNENDLANDELFGHRKGAFTGAASERKGAFERAHGGTLFLDEIGELSPQVQVKLLRVLENRRVTPLGSEKEIPVDTRLVFATNRDPAEMQRSGEMRPDFYHRICTCVIRVPPLRERIEDLPLLVRSLIPGLCEKARIDPDQVRVAPEAMELLASHDWPGNVRELMNVLARALIQARMDGDGKTITADHIQLPREPGEKKEMEEDLSSATSAGHLDAEGLLEEILASGGYQGGGIKAFRDEYGEKMLAGVISLAILRTGSANKAGKLLGFISEENEKKDSQNFRSWMRKLGLRRSEILESRAGGF